MPENTGKKYRHFILAGYSESEKFSRPPLVIEKKPLPARDRVVHGGRLLGQIAELRPGFEVARAAQEEAGLEGGFGLQVEFESFPDIDLAFESLSRERAGIELLNVRHTDHHTSATVFVPDGKLEHFEGLIQNYLAEKRDKAGRPRDNSTLLNTINQIRSATLQALWTDAPEEFPTSDDETFWWEVWLPVQEDREASVENFRRLAKLMELNVAPGELHFPERIVLLSRASAGQMRQSLMVLNSIAELRRAKVTAEFFDGMGPDQQPEWLEELLSRSQFPGPDRDVPHVCVLDTGVNNGHPLISQALSDSDLHTVEPSWGKDDGHGHGTAMAGLALMGDLAAALASSRPIDIAHRLESVKLLPTDGANGGNAIHHGYLTTEAVYRAEVTAPHRRRVIELAVTAKDNRDRGRPSAWSAALDRLAIDADGDNENPRLIIVSAGNINDPNAWAEYPASNSTDGVHDPAQAWNALTVGAFTELTNISEDGAQDYKPIAQAGDLSPFSTTSATWRSPWPFKPDVVFEGGNAAKDSLSAVWMSSLSLLTTNHEPHGRLFTTANATSAASALAARMAAQLMSAYPELWPEAIRALMVHSARWTESMRKMFLPRLARPQKGHFARLVRHCGFGVPNLEEALWSASNSLCMVVQGKIFPFMREKGKEPALRDMNLHRLPWPLEELEALGNTQVEMRVTISYFIEPNPSERGFRSRYRYESYGLRFDVKRAGESEDEFRARINAAARDAEEGVSTGGNDPDWMIGTRNRHIGSVHSDVWQGSAADLASRGVLAVYPVTGWWKTRKKHERYDKAARYALIVSIRTPEIGVDLYNAVATQIAVPVEVES